MRQHGLQFLVGPGFLCTLFQTYFAKCLDGWYFQSDIVFFTLTLQYGWLRSRGSTHRSYWRAGGPYMAISFCYFTLPVPNASKIPVANHQSSELQRRLYIGQETPHFPKWLMRTACAEECATCNLVAWTRFIQNLSKHDSNRNGPEWVASNPSLKYLAKKKVNWVLENPSTSLLFRYKPLRDPGPHIYIHAERGQCLYFDHI